MRRHAWSGAAVIAALSLITIACGEKSVSGPPAATSAQPQIALLRRFDTLAVDQSVQLTAIVPALPGAIAPSVHWASSDTNVAVVTRNGVLFALKSGRATVTASAQGVSDATSVTVHPGIRDIRFGSDLLAINLAQSVTLPYRVIDTDGNDVDLSKHRVEWSSTDPSVVPLTGDATVTGRSIGRASLLLKVDSKIGSTTIKVTSKPVSSVSVTPTSLSVGVGEQSQLTATTYDVHGTVLTDRNLVWNSANSNIAYVDADGTVTGVAAGEVDITANAEGRKVVVPVTVTAQPTSSAPVASVKVTLNDASLTAGQSTQANVALTDASSNELTNRVVAWSSSDQSIATVSATGLVTAVKGGSATFTATSVGKSGGATVTVAAASATAVANVVVTVPSSVNVGQTVQASAKLTDAGGNTLTGRSITWESSDPSIATINSSGVVSGVSGGAVTITATSEGVSDEAIVSSVAPTPTVKLVSLTSNASTIEIGQLTQVTAVVEDANGLPISGVPITWSSSDATVASVSSTGMVAGRGMGIASISAKAGTVAGSISVTVLDSATAPVPVPTTPTGTGGNGTLGAIAAIAELPRVSVNTAYPTPTRQVRVAAGSSLQAALDAAQPGDELLLAPGATWVGNFILPDKGSSTNWITVRTDASDAVIGAPGTRMTPTRAGTAKLAKILTPNNAPAIASALTAHHWRLTGLDVSGTPAAFEVNGIVRFGDGSGAQNSLSLVAHHMILDRSFVHGTSTLSVRRCMSLQSATSAIVDSWLSDCHSNNGDSQAILGYNGPGPYLIDNNHLEGGHQAIMFGGADPSITNLSPSDITITGNHMTRPLAWNGVWQTKTIYESKNSRRVLMEGNVIENVWASAQVGFAVLLKSENQNGTAPWSQTTDVTVRYNRIRNAGSGFNIAANPGAAAAVPAARMLIVDNVIDNLGVSPYTGDGMPLQVLGSVADIIVAHNSWSNAGKQAISFDGGATTRLVVHSNVIPNGSYGVKGSGTGIGIPTLTAYAPNGIFSYVSLVGADCSLYPTTTSCPNAYPSSLPMGYDGRQVGPDMTKLNSAITGTIVAP
ncbi:MAG TPA: Ig-like domain-containing protein [Gemmatimonadaceae bacterium]|nr:Ig-like domain-containing protein [Gemmatimonadaceae bacterium]